LHNNQIIPESQAVDKIFFEGIIDSKVKFTFVPYMKQIKVPAVERALTEAHRAANASEIAIRVPEVSRERR